MPWWLLPEPVAMSLQRALFLVQTPRCDTPLCGYLRRTPPRLVNSNLLNRGVLTAPYSDTYKMVSVTGLIPKATSTAILPYT
jgi:hypothetical protein